MHAKFETFPISLVACASQQLGTGRLQSAEPTVTSLTPSLVRQQTPARKQGSLTPETSPWSIMSAHKTAFGIFLSFHEAHRLH